MAVEVDSVGSVYAVVIEFCAGTVSEAVFVRATKSCVSLEIVFLALECV